MLFKLRYTGILNFKVNILIFCSYKFFFNFDRKKIDLHKCSLKIEIKELVFKLIYYVESR